MLSAAALVLLLLAMGLAARLGRIDRTDADHFFVADRSAGPWVTGFSLGATSLGAMGVLLLAGTVAGGRAEMLLAAGGIMSGLVLMGFWGGRVLRLRRVHSLPHAFAVPGARGTAVAAAVLLLLVEGGWIGMLLKLASQFSVFLPGQGPWWAVAVAAGVVVLVLDTGHRGVLRADAVAAAAMLTGLAAAVLAVFVAPEWPGLPARAPGLAPLDAGAWTLAGLLLARQFSGGAPVQRWLGLEQPGDARRALLPALLFCLSVVGLATWLGMTAPRRVLQGSFPAHEFLLRLAAALPPTPRALLNVAVWATLIGALSSLFHVSLATVDLLFGERLSSRSRPAWRAAITLMLVGLCATWSWHSAPEWMLVTEAALGVLLAPALLAMFRPGALPGLGSGLVVAFFGALAIANLLPDGAPGGLQGPFFWAVVAGGVVAATGLFRTRRQPSR